MLMPSRGASRASRSFCVAVIALVALSLAAASPAGAFDPRPVPGRMLLKLHEGADVRAFDAKAGVAQRTTGRPSLDALVASFGVTSFEAQFPGETHASKALAGSDLSTFYILQFPATENLEAVRAAFAADPAVEIAEYDWMHPVDLDPNDGTSQWHLESTLGNDAHLPGGWNHSQGSSSVLLGIADSGVAWAHPDLNGNIWTNPGETLNGVDDDGNGFVDDVRGWDFVAGLSSAWPGEDASLPDNDPSDFNGHGTHVAGIAAAHTNNGLGVAGVGWNCRIMALRIGGSINDSGNEVGVVLMSAAASALNYARLKGAIAFNCSWGSSNVSSLASAANAAVAAGMVIVVAAGNDNNQNPSYLSSRNDCFDIAATGQSDQKASFSNYGTWIDVSAPGEAILSTYYNHSMGNPHTYETLQGTSMAAPLVTGLVGLVKAAYPGYNGTQIKNAIRSGCDNLDAINPSLIGLLGSGRVNALRTFGDYKLSVPEDYSNFDRALAASGAGDTLALAGGSIYNSRFYLWRTNRHILGGWDPTFQSRDPVNNPTIVQVTGAGPALEILSGMDATLVIDGFSFSGGSARQISTPVTGTFGGGVLCIGASPSIKNCDFTGNTSGDGATVGGGGGGFFSSSSSVLENCSFSGNQAQQGAGLYAYQSTLTLSGGAVSGNTAFDGASVTTGAGILLDGGTLTLNGVTIQNNAGADEGGGAYVQSGNLIASSTTWTGNGAGTNGGHLRLAAGTATLNTSELRQATALFGGAIALAPGTSLVLRSTVLANNTANFIGGGIYAQGANADLRNVTWNANQGTAGGGDAIYALSPASAWTVRNSLISNHPIATNAAFYFQGTAPVLDWNTYWNNAGGNVTGGVLGAQDRIENPLYVNAGAGDLALGLHSPAIDRGDPAGALNDPDGSRNDRGAFGGPQAASRAPGVPLNLAVTRVSGPDRNILTWSTGPSLDVAFFAVYRGNSPTFTPSAANYIGQTPANTPTFTDFSGGPADWYRLAAIDVTNASSGFGPSTQPAATDVPPAAPQRFALHPNEPNPFNPTTIVRFDLPQSVAALRLAVYDPAGRLVRVLASGEWPAGRHQVRWDGRDAHGQPVGSGVYLARLDAAPESATRKMILVR